MSTLGFIYSSVTEAYAELCKRSKIFFFSELVNGWKPLTTLAKKSTSDVWQDYEYLSVSKKEFHGSSKIRYSRQHKIRQLLEWLLVIWKNFRKNRSCFPNTYHCAKSARVRSFSGPYFPVWDQKNSVYGHFSRSVLFASYL